VGGDRPERRCTRDARPRVHPAPVGALGAFGFTVVHFLPEHGFFSDAFPGADAHADVTPFSWAAAAFEVVADLAIGLAGMYVLRSRRQTAPSKAAPAA
jgi:hypothetical protein